ncbi:putative cytochrome P450 [Sphingobium sp. SYK-6]|uniref:cytochrome P450 n=1 Tax=Sphingobium sp. (strain NBRC 103272 / SYK-6) TaxID=627192 RepID=UPI00022775E8|nr:cytochrome P450 [Sphingobium sp. SYK-6]BAK66690.1 putative cytochrome P450 [Sphingobium sp. SYK-6]
MARDIPDYPLDIFTHDAVRNARDVDDALREFAPAVRLADGTVMIGRHAHVAPGLMDWKSFSSTSRPWHDPASLRPEILLTDDPPRHTRVRRVIGDALSPRTLDAMKTVFTAGAQALVAELKARDGKEIDAVEDVTRRFVYTVFPDALGLPPGDRTHMHGFSNMVWATMGPENALFREAMVEDFGPVITWLNEVCDREVLNPDGFGMLLFRAADEEKITLDEAKLLLQTILSAGADTTYITMANALRAWAEFPQEFAKVQADPKLVRNAFDESLRWDSPSRMAGRITTVDVPVDDMVVPAGTRVGLMFAAANRDPRFWDDPLDYRIGRDLRHSLGFGYGIHACVGRTLAYMEADALLGALAQELDSIELTGPVEPWMTTVGHGPARVPVRLHFR